MRYIFVGESPAKADVQAFWPFVPGAGARLCGLLGLNPHEFWGRVRRGLYVATNIFSWPDPDWSDRDLAVSRSLMVAQEHLQVGVGNRAWTLIMCGRRVAGAFQDDRPYFEVRETGQGNRAVVVPHPSGRCRVWNDKVSVRKFRRVMTELGVIP